MDENESPEWLHRLAVDEVCPLTTEPTTPYEIDMVNKLASFGVRVLKTAAETKADDGDMVADYIAEIEADATRLAEQKHALACGMLLAVDTLRNPRYERVSQVIEACDALFSAIY